MSISYLKIFTILNDKIVMLIYNEHVKLENVIFY